MKLNLLAATVLTLAPSAFALDGQFGIHDPSTLIQCDGKYYVYGTGGNARVSDDGWTWRPGVTPPLTGLAPDVIRLGDRFYMYVATQARQPAAEIKVISSKSLDPNSPDYKWEQGGVVASTDGIEDCNGIDPGAFLDPKTGRLWLTYGSYFGYIRMVELDAKTGKRLDPKSKPVDLAIDCEASIMIYHDGWYYLLGTHGSCCQGAASNYNIRMGRSKSVTGPFLDHDGIDMIESGGKLFLGSEARLVGAGHFGLCDLGDGVQVFSYHYEADLDRGGASVLAIRPLLWDDGWPVAGENVKQGNYMLESARTGTVLELAVEGVPLTGGRGGARGGRGPGGGGGPGGPAPAGAPPANAGVAAGAPPAAAPGGASATPGGPAAPGRGRGPGGMFAGTGSPIPPQDVAVVSKNWPAENVAPRMANYLDQAQQKWSIAPAPNAGGYPGSPYFKITVAGTDRALAATEDGELVTVSSFSGAPEQLWRIQQLTDGTYRIMPKAMPGGKEPLALSAVGSGFATLAKFNPNTDRQRWKLKGL
jgi:arabinan endo-1,5-alpha-L-arabinosidase